jgi:hypothetical protein
MSNYSRSSSNAEAEADPSGYETSIPVDPRMKMMEKTIILSDNSKRIIYMFNNLYIYL